MIDYKKRARARAKLRKAGKTVLPTRTRTPSELSFHSFRHSAVSLLKNVGAPEAVAMQIAGSPRRSFQTKPGHESLALKCAKPYFRASISRIYTHIDESSERRWIALMPDFTTLALKHAEE
jgi:hypothetical protein